jgi:hypothetical protein
MTAPPTGPHISAVQAVTRWYDYWTVVVPFRSIRHAEQRDAELMLLFTMSTHSPAYNARLLERRIAQRERANTRSRGRRQVDRLTPPAA